MFKRFSYKKKFYFSIMAFILVVLALYKKNYKPILELIPLTQEVLQESEIQQNTSLELLRSDIMDLEDLIGSTDIAPSEVQHKLLDFIAEKKITLLEIHPVHQIVKNGFKVYSIEVELTGTYAELVRLLYDIETEFKTSKVASCSFYSVKNYKTQRTELNLKILFQNYEKFI